MTTAAATKRRATLSVALADEGPDSLSRGIVRQLHDMDNIVRAVATLLSCAMRRLESPGGDEGADQELGSLVASAFALADQGRALQRELFEAPAGQEGSQARVRARVRASEQVLQRLLACAGEVMDELSAREQTLQPADCQRHAMRDVPPRIRASGG